MNFLKTHIQQVSIPDIILCKPKVKVQDLPSLDSVILSSKFDGNTGSTLLVLEVLGLAKPEFTKIKKSEVVGCKLRLRKKIKDAFLESLLLESSPNFNKKPRFQKNSIHLHIYDVFKIEDANNLISYLDGFRSLDIVILAKNSRCPYFFKSLGFNL